MIKKTNPTRFILIVITLLVFFSCTDNTRYQFAVVGDFQQPNDSGYKKISHEIVKQIAESQAKFVVIVGDLISGTGDIKWEQFDDLVRPLQDAGKEIYAVIGNNDCWSKEMSAGFETRFGKRFQFVNKPGLSMIFMDSEARSHGRGWHLGNQQMNWLKAKPWEEDPEYIQNQLCFFFIHRPLYRSKLMRLDPTGKYGKSNPKLAKTLESLGANAVFSGHEHLYEKKDVKEVSYFITGGGGGDLLTSGFHHFLLISVSPEKKKWKADVIKVKTDEKPVFKKSPLSK